MYKPNSLWEAVRGTLPQYSHLWKQLTSQSQFEVCTRSGRRWGLTRYLTGGVWKQLFWNRRLVPFISTMFLWPWVPSHVTGTSSTTDRLCKTMFLQTRFLMRGLQETPTVWCWLFIMNPCFWAQSTVCFIWGPGPADGGWADLVLQLKPWWRRCGDSTLQNPGTPQTQN